MSTRTPREKAVFVEALEIADREQRSQFLDQACGADQALREQVEKLLALSQGAGDFFKDCARALEPAAGDAAQVLSAAESAVEPETPETRCIGPYKLLQKLGEGGYGVVYMAEQEQPIRRRVALKIIKLGMDTKSVTARFEAERQALALMDHPSIARVLDAGATQTGRPYFVMELVYGVKITEYCDQNRVSMQERLELFVQVCSAVQHAHQKGIIHRDLKPSNIMVTMHDGVPVPKVIDFGIAKATEQRLTDKTLFTSYAQLMGTPAYMSPEQMELSGLNLDTRSDIYSLGVLLFELLTGRTPFDSTDLLKSGMEELRRTVCEREPLRPSATLQTLNNEQLTKTARMRRTEPPRLLSQVRGDLDWIVLKCLEKDRTRRYATADGLAGDIERYLNDEPVIARPPSRLYRLRKLIRRNRLVFAASGAVALALIVGLGASTWLLSRERELRQRAIAAEQEQARLRGIAERELASEAELRQQAEARGKIAQAASLIEKGAYPEADALVGQLPLKQSTMEGAAVFRALGEWQAIQEHWPAARDRFLLLEHVTQADEPEDTTMDSTRMAVTLVECRDREAYQQYRLETIRKYANTVDPIIAERTVKNCLLLPGNDALIKALDPLAQVVLKSLEAVDLSDPSRRWNIPWRCLSLALWEYRVGSFSEAINWSRRCLNYGSTTGRVAAARTVLAMALYRLGDSEHANFELGQARTPVEAKFKSSLDAGEGSQGFWFDWILDRILLREGTELMGKASTAPPREQKTVSD